MTMTTTSLPKIIGLLARSRSGKDTVCDYIISNYPNIHIQKRRLAQPVKDAVCALYGFTSEQLEGSYKDVVDKRIGISPRNAMVKITHDVMESMGHDFFSRKLFSEFDENKNSANTIIIPDVRYSHDILEIKKRGGIVIKIERHGLNVPRYKWEDIIDNMKGDCHILNDSSIEELYYQVDQIIRNL